MHSGQAFQNTKCNQDNERKISVLRYNPICVYRNMHLELICLKCLRNCRELQFWIDVFMLLNIGPKTLMMAIKATLINTQF